MEKKIANYMKKYGISREEAIEMIAYDAEADKMTIAEIKKTLTPEQIEAQKAMTITTSEKKRGERKVERKPNEDKRSIIQKIFAAVLGIDEKAVVSNVERQIDFTVGETNYSITLTAHRKPKK